MFELAALTINITMHARTATTTYPRAAATSHRNLHYHDSVAGKGEEFQVSKVRWMNVGIAQVKGEDGTYGLVNHPGEVWTKETYSEGDPWRRVPMLARFNNTPTVTFENIESLRAAGPVLEEDVYVSELETAKPIQKQQLFYLGQLMDGSTGDLAGEWDAPEPGALKAAMLNKSRESKNRRKFKAGEAVVLAALQHVAGASALAVPSMCRTKMRKMRKMTQKSQASSERSRPPSFSRWPSSET